MIGFAAKSRAPGVLAGLAILLLAIAPPVQAQLDRPPEEDEVDYSPGDGTTTSVNPPPFVWLPLDDVDSYILQLSRSSDFPPAETITIGDVPRTIYIPDEELDTGRWFWRYGYRERDDTRLGRPREFIIADDAVSLPFPDIEDVLARIPDARPRVYYSPDKVKEIRADEDGRYSEIVSRVVRQAEAVLEREEPLFEEPKPWDEFPEDELRAEYLRIFRAMRPYTEGMHICAQAYLFTGDERFAEEAKRRLMHFMTWDVDGPSSVIWPSELGMDIAERAPRTFDWIYDTLSEEERELCLEVLGKRIAQINERHRSMPFESRPFSSHPGRMIGFAIEGSLVLAHDVPEAAEWLEYTLRLLWSVYPAWGGEDGGWHEGLGYWGGYMRRIMNVVTELDRHGIPIKEKPFFRNTGWYGFYHGYPGRQQRGYGDGFEARVTGGHGHNLYIFATLYQNPYFRWSAEELGGRPVGPVAALILDPELEPKAPSDIPQSRAFFDSGSVALHSNMANPDDNVMLVMTSSPFGSISHNHANQNAFTVDAFGEPLAITSGYYHGYGDPHHSEWVWQTRSHNSVLVDGEGQTPRSRSASGKIITHEEHGDWAYTAGDATAAYDGRLAKFVRHVIFLRPDHIVMIDDLESSGDEGSTFQWLLHARKEMALDSENQRVVSSSGDARLQVQFLQPEGLDFTQESGWEHPPARPDEGPPQFHFTASTTEAAETTRIVSVLSPYRAGQADEIAEPRLRDAEGGIAIEIGGDVLLWKAPAADEVRYREHRSNEPVTVIHESAD